MARLLLFYRLIVRPLWRDPLRTALTAFAVALGVSVVVAIELAGNAAAGSFHSSMEALEGDAELEVVAAGGVPDAVAAAVATLTFPIQVRPRLEDFAMVMDTRQALPLLGLDLIAEGNGLGRELAGVKLDNGDLLQYLSADSVWTGSRLGRKPGDRIRLLINDQAREYTVRGVFDDAKEGGSAILMDIAAAGLALGRPGRVDRVLIKIPDGSSVEEWTRRLRAALPEGVEIRSRAAGAEQNQKLLSAFRMNLRMLSYVALIVGAFLIYNTIAVSVARRRAEIGIVRALGAGRGAVMAAFLGEAGCLGAAGALLGLPLGRVMATGAVRLLGATVESLYVSSRPGPLELSSGTVLLALATGMGVALISAASPAREAALVSPVDAMARGRRESTARIHKMRDLWLALGLGLCGAAAARAPAVAGTPVFGYLSGALLIAAAAFAVPAMAGALLALSSGWLRKWLGAEALLASRSLAGSLRRTSILVGTLATAIALMTSVGIMVGSFRQTVLIWMNGQLPSDLYLRPAGHDAPDRHPTLSPDLAARLAGLPGVAGVDRLRAYEIDYGGLPATLIGIDLIALRSYRSSDFLSGRPPEEVLHEVRNADAAIVSEPFANKHGLRAGDFLTLPLGEKKAAFRIADVYYDYACERGCILLDRATLLRYLPDPALSNLSVDVAAGASLEAVRAEVEKAAAGRNVLIFSNRDLRREAVRIFDRTFAITYALEAISIIVAVMGVAGALLALVIDRRREFGLLRFLGATRIQVRKLVLVEAGLLGLLANLAGIALGVVLSLLLIFVINKQSFGWTIRFHWPVAVLVGSLALVYLATVLTGLYPARVAVRLNPIEVVHEE